MKKKKLGLNNSFFVLKRVYDLIFVFCGQYNLIVTLLISILKIACEMKIFDLSSTIKFIKKYNSETINYVDMYQCISLQICNMYIQRFEYRKGTFIVHTRCTKKTPVKELV